jgi:hypothetical protein
MALPRNPTSIHACVDLTEWSATRPIEEAAHAGMAHICRASQEIRS